MREIKFRAWDSVRKQMYLSPDEIKHLGGWFDAHRFDGLENGTTYVMQFTGLKDKNGREVYEGDILKITDKYDSSSHQVLIRKVSFEQRAPACGFVLGDAEHDYVEHFGRIMKDDDTDWDVEVIGNIYENFDLLKA
jgi:uncharacterized phage protein (TIGR01671 family)